MVWPPASSLVAVDIGLAAACAVQRRDDDLLARLQARNDLDVGVVAQTGGDGALFLVAGRGQDGQLAVGAREGHGL